jgi:hypothetical protein
MRFTLCCCCLLAALPCRALDRIEVVRTGFVVKPSGREFIPWGLNYGNAGRLIEDFWDADWAVIEKDFAEMKKLGANVVRVHLQFGKFMGAVDRANRAALERLGKLIVLAEQVGLYLDLTGLGSYRKADVPPWYDALDEAGRWRAQASFWEAIAGVAPDSPAIFCYDLMNEPIVPGQKRNAGEWLSGKPFGAYDFVQFITLDPAGRAREDIAIQWIDTLSAAIRKRDRTHPITVGQLPWDRKWGHLSGFVPEKVAPHLDFISVHIYPQSGKVDEALEGLKKFAVGDKPVVIEETFNLSCSPQEVEDFIRRSKGTACGWMGHYDGKSIANLEALKASGKITIAESIWLNWLQVFQKLAPQQQQQRSPKS